METAETATYESLKSELFQAVPSHAAFHEYWNSFRAFVLGRLAKGEFDAVVLRILGADKGASVPCWTVVHVHSDMTSYAQPTCTTSW